MNALAQTNFAGEEKASGGMGLPGALSEPLPDGSWLLPPITFSTRELAEILIALRKMYLVPGVVYVNQYALLAHIIEIHFEEKLGLDKAGLFQRLGISILGNDLRIEQGELPQAVPLPENVTRADVMDGLREILRQAVCAQQLVDKSFVRWPTMDAIMEHLEVYGLEPRENVSHEATKGTEEKV